MRAGERQRPPRISPRAGHGTVGLDATMVIMTRYGLLGEGRQPVRLHLSTKAGLDGRQRILFAVDPPSMLYVEGLALHSA
jgi:hypothetical protein